MMMANGRGVPESTERVWKIAMTALMLVTYFASGEDLKMEHREGAHKGDCSPEESRRCTLLAEPLLRDPDLVFPDNMADIDRVCRTWRQLVGCVGSYTGRCFSEDRREAFQKGAGGALASVNALCTQSAYQKEYLGHAPCIKATLTLKDHCGMFYEQMVANTAISPHTSDKANMCCAHNMFRECVIREAKQNCDLPEDELKRIAERSNRKWTKGPSAERRTASQFAQQVLDQALNFIMEQCRQYVLDSKDCMDDRNGIEKDGAKSNKTIAPITTPLVPPIGPPTNTPNKAERGIATTSDDNKSNQPWLPAREDESNRNTRIEDKNGEEEEGAKSDPFGDEVVKVVNAPKLKSGARGRSEIGAGRSLEGRVRQEGDSVAWTSGAWSESGWKNGDTTTVVSSLGRKPISTTEAWYPSYYHGNSLERASQQGLSSGTKISNFNFETLLPVALFVLRSSYCIGYV